ncbi:MAG: FHA domain-containing protein [Deltaproteobacteria bacterium]|nr:FHA domain-containing protein [Deltaproteobacteria bacterium]
MAFDDQWLELLACPRCLGKLCFTDQSRAVGCEPCRMKFQIRDGIPLLVIDQTEAPKKSKSKTSRQDAPRPTLKILSGQHSPSLIEIECATCVALGRAEMMDDEKTVAVAVDLAIALDDRMKSLINAYIKKQFERGTTGRIARHKKNASDLGTFRRLPDIKISDTHLSKLHAMLFSDDHGTVGILDLVSKNGTYVNGEEIESKLLRKGDVIELGETKMVFEG